MQIANSSPMTNTSMIVELFRVTPRTARNWIRHGFPYYALERLSMIDGSHPDWPGYRLLNGLIITPAGETVTKEEISFYHWLNEEAHRSWKAHDFMANRVNKFSRLSAAANEPSCFNSLTDLLDQS